jgi:hypothetical protein
MSANVRFGSKADICAAKGHVRFASNSDRKSGRRMSAAVSMLFRQWEKASPNGVAGVPMGPLRRGFEAKMALGVLFENAD